MQGFWRGRGLKADICEYFFSVPQNEENELLCNCDPPPPTNRLGSRHGHVVCFSVCIDRLVFIVGRRKNSSEQEDFTGKINLPLSPVYLLAYSSFHFLFLFKSRNAFHRARYGPFSWKPGKRFPSFLPQLRNWKFGNGTKFKVLAFTWSSHPSAGETHCPGLFKKSLNSPEH